MQPVITQSQNINDHFRKACLCPVINLSDLTIEDVVLEAAYHRAEGDPCDFAKLDILNTSIEQSDHHPLSANRNLRMLLFHQRTSEQYGKIVPEMLSDPRYSIGLEVGLLILEIQDFIYDFYLRFVKQILAPDFEQMEKRREGPMVDVVQRLQQRWPTLYSTAFRTAYQPHQSDILRHLESLAHAEREYHVNLLADLREDPRTFIAILRESQKYLREASPSTEMYAEYRDSDYAEATKSMLCHIMTNVVTWNYIRLQLQRLVGLEDTGMLLDDSGAFKSSASISFQTLETYCQDFCNIICSILIPKMDEEARPTNLSTEEREAASCMEVLDNLVRKLWGSNQRNFNSLDALVSEMQKHLNANPHLALWMTARRLRALNHGSLSAELRRQLHLFKPTGHTCSLESTQRAKLEKLNVKDRAIDRLTSIVKSYCDERSLNPKDKMFFYPTISKTQEGKDRQRAARQALDEFWIGLDQALGHDSLLPIHQPQSERWHENIHHRTAILEGPFVEVRQIATWNRRRVEKQDAIDDTYDHGDNDDDVQNTTESGPAQAAPVQEALVPAMDSLDIRKESAGITLDRPKRFKRNTSPDKVKTKGKAAVVHPEPDTEDQEPEIQRTKVKVDDKTRKLLQIAFKCYRGRPPGEIHYSGILHMMRELGFEAKWNVAGYMFHREDHSAQGLLRRPPTLHRPHGPVSDAKLARNQFYNFVGRLERQYDWFVKERFDLDD